jgi:purine-nucleoside/S-methyl-5'-thioadenosine phosphorylase / adenosine deaminase
MENLDRDRSRHGGLRCPIYRAHSPRADLVQNPKLAAQNFSMQEWVGGAHASVLIAELEASDDNPRAALTEKRKPMNCSQYLRSQLLASAGFTHAFFTREGGVSSGSYGSLNVSPAVGDRAEDVAENRRLAAAVLGLEDARVYVPRQVHDRGVIVVDGSESMPEIELCAGDAVVSDGSHLACAIRTADCVPLLMADRETRRVAAIHAGWRGVVKGVARATVDAFVARGSRPEHLIVAIGPHISLAAFEVGPEVARELSEASDAVHAVVTSEGAKPHVDLTQILGAQLVALGLSREAIDVLPACTFSDAARFFSYRRNGQQSGRQLSAIVSELRSPASRSVPSFGTGSGRGEAHTR